MTASTLLRVEPVQFQAASRVIGETVADRVLTAVWQLVDDLAGASGMAGSDPSGVAWSDAYDRAADAAVATSTDLVTACFRLAALLQQSGLNYGRAEVGARGGVLTEDRNDYADRAFTVAALVSAVGGGGSAPTGWSLVEHAVGYVWPNGHQDRLHAASATWTAFGEAVSCAADDVLPAIAAVADQQAPEVDRAEAACRAVRTHLQDLAATARNLAAACTDYAAHLDDAHSQVEHELISLLEWTAAIETAGAVGAVFTFGASEAVAQAAEASRIAAAAARIAEILQKLGALARGAAEYVANLGYDVARISRELNPLLTSRIVVAMVESRGGLAVRATESIEARLGQRLDADGIDLGRMTAHGAERVAGPGATRGGVLSAHRIREVRMHGRIRIQADGAMCRVLQNVDGRFDVVIDGEGGLITSFRNLSTRSLDRLATRYGWTK